MRAIRVDEHGGPEVLRTVVVPRPEPGPGQVAVDVTHVALNHLDLWVRRGVPGHRFPLPLIPGSDVAGVRADTGQPVVLHPGFGCMACPRCLSGRHDLCRRYIIRGERGDGGMCERVVVPEAELLPIPAGMDPAHAAALPLALLTAWHMLRTRAGIAPGDRVLVQAGASGVGVMAIQIAKLCGARVVATASSPDKRELCRALGAEHAWSYEDAATGVRDWTGKEGVDIAVDHVGAATWPLSLRALRWGGTYVTCGATAGHEVALDLRAVFFKQLSVLGSTMGGMGELCDAWKAVQAGAIRPVVDRVGRMSALGEAHALLEDRAIAGKIVVRQDLGEEA
ncbi:MAG: zinc-binding dehydrogenase [Alphaproteobacteria bacterium]|nr:zinc-binding dehydrogenase [Alphaproteobacteria bacterium]